MEINEVFCVKKHGESSTSETWLLENTIAGFTFFEDENEAINFKDQCNLESNGNERYYSMTLNQAILLDEFDNVVKRLFDLYSSENKIIEMINLFMTYKPYSENSGE